MGLGACLSVLSMFCSACGSSGSGSAVKAVGPAYEVTTAQVGSLGRILVDGSGYTLYLYVPDDHSGHSACAGTCIVGWPPLLLPRGVSAPIAGPGVSSSLLGETRRSNGSEQVTYGGWPLYRWANDTSTGEATGQGLFNSGGLWYVLDAEGNPVH